MVPGVVGLRRTGWLRVRLVELVGTHPVTGRYTFGMTTTIKVSDELRDRLKRQAARDGLTLGAHLARLADAEDRRRRLSDLKVAIAATPANDLRSHEAETAIWERSELTDATS